ncbi:unnamed protein product [Linum trigynum]|uniref:Uncharacterized protein n=1 Tax=Linum trigynum TaxID=586398 RepID=A0AAV2CYK0_9ROSI
MDALRRARLSALLLFQGCLRFIRLGLHHRRSLAPPGSNTVPCGRSHPLSSLPPIHGRGSSTLIQVEYGLS